MNELKEIYETLKAEGLCSTLTEFSEVWLGRSKHYMAQIGGDPRKASLTSLRLLVRELELTCLDAKRGASDVTYRRLRAAFVAAQTLCNGIYEMRHVPRCYWVSAT